MYKVSFLNFAKRKYDILNKVCFDNTDAHTYSFDCDRTFSCKWYMVYSTVLPIGLYCLYYRPTPCISKLKRVSNKQPPAVTDRLTYRLTHGYTNRCRNTMPYTRRINIYFSLSDFSCIHPRSV